MGSPSRQAAVAAVLLCAAALTLDDCRQPMPRPPGRSVALAPCLPPAAAPDPNRPTAGMVRLPGGVFSMGAQPARPEEGPARRVRLKAFWIDRTDVTNAAFARFVAATGYVTEAERPLDPALYPGLTARQRRPSSLVFVGARPGVDLRDPSQWWRIVPGADWRHPGGPGTDIAGEDSLPVVQVGYSDALAYARWLGRDLPTEAEWEYAARGGLDGERFVWGAGDDPATSKRPRANVWQGVFPVLNTGADGYKASPSPVGCFAANGFGLYDMAGNVWQWTRDWYRPGLDDAGGAEPGGPPMTAAYDPNDPGRPKHVIKGGSFLCSDNFCWRYRPAAREAGPPDAGASHIGFRTVYRGG